MKLRTSARPFSTVLALTITMLGCNCRSSASSVPPKSTEVNVSTEANITEVTSRLLEHSQFSHRSLDDELAGAFLDRYIDSLDPTRTLFVQSDIDEFGAYRNTLAEATRGRGDTEPARAIFARFLQRLGERVTFVDDTLKNASFDFTGHDSYSFDREHAGHPSDLAAAHALWLLQLRAEYLQEKLGEKNPDGSQIAKTLSKRYAEQLSTMKNVGKDEVLEIYLEALAHVYDPHSDYMGHEQMESLSIAMNLSLVGIGAALETADGFCKIHDLVPGGPAALSGALKAGDRIVAVGQASEQPVDIVNMPLSRAVELIRGAKGSIVSLKVIPAAAPDGSVPTTVMLVRDLVKLEDQEAKAEIIDLPTDKGKTVRLGVIDLPSFYADIDGNGGADKRSATVDVERLLAKLKEEQVRGVILDLRHNGGGSLGEAISLTGLFIRTGPVVQTRNLAGEIEEGDDTDPSVAYDGPLMVLTSRYSASASEILAGALQDYGRALVVGDSSTFGKGTVQTIAPLAKVMDKEGLDHDYDPGALKITISKFYRPSGASTQLRGVASDIVLPSTSDVGDISESALKNPLPWDVIPPAHYRALNEVAPFLGELKEKSARRLTTDKDFAFLREDIAKEKERLASKSVSLNEAERRQELADDKARKEQRAREAQAALETKPTTYEITVAHASEPGLKVATPESSRKLTGPNRPDNEAKAEIAEEDATATEAERILADYVDLWGTAR